MKAKARLETFTSRVLNCRYLMMMRTGMMMIMSGDDNSNDDDLKFDDKFQIDDLVKGDEH